MKHLLTLFIVCAGISGLWAQESGMQFLKGDLANGLAEAKKANKLVFVDCYTTWCGPCKWMDKNVFPNDEAGAFYNANFVNMKIDMEKGNGLEVAKKYGVKSYPTYLFLDADGNIMHRAVGSMPADMFVQVGQTALDPNQRLAKFMDQYEAQKQSPEFILEYATALENAGDNSGADEVASTYLGSLSNEEFLMASNWDIVKRYSTNIKGETYQYVLTNKQQFEKKYDGEVADYLVDAALRSLPKAAMNKDDKTYQDVLVLVLENAENPDLSVNYAKLRYNGMTKNWTVYAKAAIGYFEEYTAQDLPALAEGETPSHSHMSDRAWANQLNQYAWTFYEQIDDKDQLKAAVDMIDQAIGIDENYAFLDTKAAVLFKLGDLEAGKEAANRAIEVAKESGEDFSETTKLIEKHTR